MALYHSTGLPAGWSSSTELDCLVDVTRLVGRVNHRLNGIAVHSLASLDDYPYHRAHLVYSLPIEVQRDLLGLRVPCSRILNTYEDEQRFGAFERVLDGYETCLRLWGWQRANLVVCPGTVSGGVGYSPSELAERLYQMGAAGYRLFEVENEPYNGKQGGGSRFPYSLAGESAYIDYLSQVYHQVKSRAPQLRLLVRVLGTNLEGDSPYYTEGLLQRAAGVYDGISCNGFLTGSVVDGQVVSAYTSMGFQDWVVGENLRMMRHLEAIYQAAQGVPIYLTSWGSAALGGSGGYPKDGNIWAVLANAYRLLLLHDTRFAAMACAWYLLDEWYPERADTGRFLFLRPDQPGRRGFLYWLWYYFVRHLGDYYVDVGGSAPTATVTDSRGGSRSGLLTPVLATVSWHFQDLYLVLVNASWDQSYQATVRFHRFAPQAVSSVVMKHDDQSALGVVEGAPEGTLVHPVVITRYYDRIRFVLQPHSVYFVRVSGSLVTGE